MFHRPSLALLLSIAATITGAATPIADRARAAEGAPSFALPVDCALGVTCEIQFHVDLAPGSEVRDYACGRLTYDEHKGTDFRLPDYPAMRAGVAVLAAADGEVRAVREGEPDISVDSRGPENLEGKDAGNAVVLAHGDGWETQYSHLMQGSIAVKPGDQVKAGQVLGKIGLSGRSNFPHLDFAVRRDGAVVDPFLGAEPGATCERPGTPLWDEAARAAMPYRSSGVLLAGFAAVEPDKEDVRQGGERALAFGPDAPLLVFYADVFGILEGDTEEFVITGPDGGLIARHENVLTKDIQQRFQYVGKKRPRDGWRPGTYRGAYRLIRNVAGAATMIAYATREAIISGR